MDGAALTIDRAQSALAHADHTGRAGRGDAGAVKALLGGGAVTSPRVEDPELTGRLRVPELGATASQRDGRLQHDGAPRLPHVSHRGHGIGRGLSTVGDGRRHLFERRHGIDAGPAPARVVQRFESRIFCS